jgi:hypothetical protein
MAESVRDSSSWHDSGSGAPSCRRTWHRKTAAIVFAGFF